jgi:hypothetical protein
VPHTVEQHAESNLYVRCALEIAQDAHRDQVDKAGQPYMGHIMRVAEYVAATGAPWPCVVVALLHDTVEDTRKHERPVTLDSLGHIFPSPIIMAVDAMTHRPGEPRQDYRDRIKANPVALLVKAEGDLRDNTDPRRALSGPEADRRSAKYAADRIDLNACAYPRDHEQAHDHDDCVSALVCDAEDWIRST